MAEEPQSPTRHEETSGRPSMIERIWSRPKDTKRSPSRIERLMIRLRMAQDLKEYAISSNIDIPDDIFERLNVVEASLVTGEIVPEVTDKLDSAIRDLTTFTYPTTIESLAQSTPGPGRGRAFKVFTYMLIFFGLISLFLGIVAYDSAESAGQRVTADSALVALITESVRDTSAVPLETVLASHSRIDSLESRLATNLQIELRWKSLLAASLGLLGAVVYVIFNIIGILSEKAFYREDTYSNYARIVLGPILGWVFFFGIGTDKIEPGSFLVLVPFLAGFSTKLVVGVFNQAIRAVELTLGIEDRSSMIRRRRNQAKSPPPG